MSTSWVCNLVEAIHYKTLEETYQVQRCFTGKDRVCDTTYDIDTTTKDDYQLGCPKFSKKLVLTHIICPGLYLYLKQHQNLGYLGLI